MSDELPNGLRNPQPVRAKENSPPIYRWDSGRCAMPSPGRDERNWLRHPAPSFAPDGASDCFDAINPAMNRWAISGCPCGTNTNGGVER